MDTFVLLLLGLTEHLLGLLNKPFSFLFFLLCSLVVQNLPLLHLWRESFSLEAILKAQSVGITYVLCSLDVRCVGKGTEVHHFGVRHFQCSFLDFLGGNDVLKMFGVLKTLVRF